MVDTQVALLRGINLLGRNKLPMKDLAEVFVEAGCKDVQTYIQSGNVVFRCPRSASARLPEVIGVKVAERFGHKPRLLLRTAEQMQRILRSNPFLKAGAPEEHLHVLFLADVPSPDRVKLLDPHRSPPDQFEVWGQEIYLRLPNGVADSKLTSAYFDSKLATWCTSRNWRTVTKLLGLMKAERRG